MHTTQSKLIKSIKAKAREMRDVSDEELVEFAQRVLAEVADAEDGNKHASVRQAAASSLLRHTERQQKQASLVDIKMRIDGSLPEVQVPDGDIGTDKHDD